MAQKFYKFTKEVRQGAKHWFPGAMVPVNLPEYQIQHMLEGGVIEEYDYVEVLPEPIVEESVEEEADVIPAEIDERPSINDEPVQATDEDMRAEFEGMKIAELKEILKAMDLPIGGKKDELIDRIMAVEEGE